MYEELKQVADFALFAKIVQTGGISRCARELGMERTSVSRRLKILERNLGVKLLDRTPRIMVLTEAGRRCLKQCEKLLEASQNAYVLATLSQVTGWHPILGFTNAPTIGARWDVDENAPAARETDNRK